MNRRSLLLGLSGAAVLAAAGGWTLLRPGATTEDLVASPAEAGGSPQILPDVTLGSSKAPVTLIEYASFTCPHCAHFQQDVFKPLKRDYIDTGKVRFILREAYFDRYGLWAGQIAQCGGDLKYYAIADMMFAEQQAWIGDGQPETIGANLRKIGLRAGLTKDQIEACLNDNARAQAMVATYQKHFTDDGITGTPSLVINGTKYDNMSYADLKKILDPLLGG
ncbi:DsbA family protein [Rhodobacter maris]|uniref:Protein-disulfide isomerase n=1 Tax=Rhodobacter maris TaxID=446682 RepID=A0A285RLK0_9RHOB|nr:DsbA family protein [Rhodobacter maris]SOB94995.1 protein-disulfide isomerase [Rhodobacter maris]